MKQNFSYHKAKTACYPSGNRVLPEIAAYCLLAIGALLLFLCIPGWAWAALIGCLFIVAGIILLKISQVRRS